MTSERTLTNLMLWWQQIKTSKIIECMSSVVFCMCGTDQALICEVRTHFKLEELKTLWDQSSHRFELRSSLALIFSQFHFYLSDCVYSFVLVSFGIKIKFHAAYGLHPIPYHPRGHHQPHPNPYRPPSSPLNQGQCLSVSKADSIDFRNHSISFSSSHRLTTKEKKTHFTHTTKEKIDFTCTPQKKTSLSPTQLLSLCQTIQSPTCFTPSLL